MPIVIDVDAMLTRRKVSVALTTEQVGIATANLASLRAGRAKAVRFSTLGARFKVLDCQPGDLSRWETKSGIAQGRPR